MASYLLRRANTRSFSIFKSKVERSSLADATRPSFIPSLRSIIRDEPKDGGWIPSSMHNSGEVKFTIVRVPPGAEVPTHLHSVSWDYFLPLAGQGRISVYQKDSPVEEQHYEMRKDTFLAVPPGDTHVVRNKLDNEEFVFMIAQAPNSGYDFVRQTEPSQQASP